MSSASLFLTIRFAKLLAVVLLGAGTIGAAVARPIEVRRVFAYGLAGPGLGLSWIFGFVLAYLRGQPLLSLFVLSALLVPMVGLHGTLYLAGREERRTPLAAAVAIVPFVVTIWIMVFRPF